MSTILSELRSCPRSLFYVLVLGLSLRLLFIALNQRPLISDEREYDSLAYSLSTSTSYSFDGAPTAYRPIGYPAIVGALYYMVGHHATAVKCFQAVLDIGTAFLLYLLLTSYSNRIRVLAAGLWSFYIPAVLYTNLLMSETASAFLLTLTAFLALRNSEIQYRTLTATGICFGMLVLIKPGVIVLPILLLFLLPKLNIARKSLYPATLAFLLVLAPWIARNFVLFDRFALSSNGGINLLIGNNPHATGAYGITFDPEILRDSKGEFDTDRLALRWASSYIAQHPVQFALNAAKKLGRFFESEGGLLVLTFHSDPENAAVHYSSKYSSIPLLLTLLTNLPYFLLLTLGIFGFLASHEDPIWWFTLAVLGSWLIVHLVYFGGGRFHFPIMPFAAVFAAVCLGGGKTLITSLTIHQKVVGSVIVVLLASLWVFEGISVFNA